MQDTTDKRSQILNAGLSVMRAKGYNGTGVKDIVDAAGIPKGSFYNYFTSKEEFAIEALRQVAEGNLTQMRRQLEDGSRPALQRLVQFFQGHVDHLTRSGQFEGGCFIGKICQEMADVNDAIREAAGELLGQYEQTFVGCLTQAQQAGELPAGIEPRAFAGFLFSAWEGALIRMKSSKSAKPLDDFILTLKQLLTRPD